MLNLFRKAKHNNEDINKISISFENNIMKVNILEECTFLDFTSISELENIEIPIRMIIRNCSNVLRSILLKQSIYLIQNDRSNLIITVNDHNILISNRAVEKERINETLIHIKKDTDEYKIMKYIHDLNHNTKLFKSYPSIYDCFSLKKKEALSLVSSLFQSLEVIDQIEEIIDIGYLYDTVNLVRNSKYYPVISDNDITLSWKYKEKEINDEQNGFLNIVMNDTKEIIGDISFDYMCKSGFTYSGNVSYFIKEEYRNHHYATKSLKLLKKLLQNNHYSGDRDLYISTLQDNLISQKVAVNNGGELVYFGEVPRDNMLRIIDGVEEVKVYHIKM